MKEYQVKYKTGQMADGTPLYDIITVRALTEDAAKEKAKHRLFMLKGYPGKVWEIISAEEIKKPPKPYGAGRGL